MFITSGVSAVVRPKVHYARPSHPPPDPPILEGAVGGNEARLPNFGSHTLIPTDLEAFKQRHSYPERLVRSRSSDIVSSVRRPMSDPGWNRRPGNEERELPMPTTNTGTAVLMATSQSSSSSPSKDSSRGEVRLLFIISWLFFFFFPSVPNIIIFLMPEEKWY